MARILTHYRVPFHNAVREQLAKRGVEYNLIYGSPTEAEAAKGDLADVSWGVSAKTTYLGKFAYMHIKDLNAYDLVIIGQELKNINNYSLQLRRRVIGGAKLAYFGHGRNFQANNADSFGEKIKSALVHEVDWWFGYTDKTREIVESAGYPAERITVFNNSVDVGKLRSQVLLVSESEKIDLANSMNISQNTAIYIGGIYPEKRIKFLIDSAKIIRAHVPDFTLVIVGGGVDQAVAASAAVEYDWIKYIGPKFGREKAMLATMAKVLLLPGLVGLAVLDSFAYGLPLVTTRVPWHSPEIDYLRNNENGIIVEDFESEEAYASKVVELLNNEPLRSRLASSSAASASEYSIERMGERFAVGAIDALRAPHRLWQRRPPR